MANISHTAAFKAQSDFAPEAKLKIGNDIWSAETAGSRFYAQVLSKNTGTVQKVIDSAAKLEPPFTSKQVQGHLRWLYTAGRLEVDGKSYVVQAKAPKAKPEPKAKEVKVGKYAARLKAKPEVKAEAKAEATHQRRMVRTKL